MTQTPNDCIEKLKPLQQDYIVHCVKEYSDRADFHRGLLPFLSGEEAVRCLRIQLQNVIERNAGLTTPQIGVKYITNIISILLPTSSSWIYKDETSVTMYINSIKLKRAFKGRFKEKMLVTCGHSFCPESTGAIVELHYVVKDAWMITAHKNEIDKVTTWLAETFR